VVYDSLTDRHLTDMMLAIVNGDKSALASLVDYPVMRDYPLKAIADSAQMVDYFDVVFDDSIRGVMRQMKVSSWDFHNYQGITFANGEYLWATEGGKIYSINYRSANEQALLDSLRRQEMASLDPSLQGEWYPMDCLRDIHDGTVFRIDGHFPNRVDNYGEEIRMAVYDGGKDLNGKPSRLLMGVYYNEGSWPSFYLYCSSHMDMVWLSLAFDDRVEPDGIRMKYYVRGEERDRIVVPCYWLDLLK